MSGGKAMVDIEGKEGTKLIVQIGRTPRKNDVLFGRGKSIAKWPGNVAFRRIVGKYRSSYVKAKASQKQYFVERVFKTIQGQNPPGRFLERDMNKPGMQFLQAEHDKAFEKIRQALREKRFYLPGAAAPPTKRLVMGEQRDGTKGLAHDMVKSLLGADMAIQDYQEAVPLSVVLSQYLCGSFAMFSGYATTSPSEGLQGPATPTASFSVECSGGTTPTCARRTKNHLPKHVQDFRQLIQNPFACRGANEQGSDHALGLSSHDDDDSTSALEEFSRLFQAEWDDDRYSLNLRRPIEQ